MPSDRDLFQRIATALKDEKPGLAAQLKMVPRPRPGQALYTEVEQTAVKAGVLVLLYIRDGAPHLVLIRRPGTVLHHKDQISFPGGQIEPGEDFLRAALRETGEEIGVPARRIEVLGELTPLYIPPSNFIVYPVVAAAGEAPVFIPRAEEVAEVIEVPLARLLEPASICEEQWTIRGDRVHVPFYAFGKHKIWGATAMILAEFLEVIRSV